MVNFDFAKTTAQAQLQAFEKQISYEPTPLAISKIREADICWIFYWCDKRYLESRDPRYFLAGNAPIAVMKDSGQVLTAKLGTFEEIVEDLKRRTSSEAV